MLVRGKKDGEIFHERPLREWSNFRIKTKLAICVKQRVSHLRSVEDYDHSVSRQSRREHSAASNVLVPLLVSVVWCRCQNYGVGILHATSRCTGLCRVDCACNDRMQDYRDLTFIETSANYTVSTFGLSEHQTVITLCTLR